MPIGRAIAHGNDSLFGRSFVEVHGKGKVVKERKSPIGAADSIAGSA